MSRIVEFIRKIQSKYQRRRGRITCRKITSLIAHGCTELGTTCGKTDTLCKLKSVFSLKAMSQGGQDYENDAAIVLLRVTGLHRARTPQVDKLETVCVGVGAFSDCFDMNEQNSL